MKCRTAFAATIVTAMLGFSVQAAQPEATQTERAAIDPSTADAAIAERMMGAVQPFRTARVVLWADPDTLSPADANAFAGELEKGLIAIERLTGEQVDSAHYGAPVVNVFVSGRVTVSHVYGGYAHQRFNRPYLFLNPKRVARREAPYLHELTHIVLWRFGSHSLREGLASYVEGRLAQEGVGYNSGVFGPGPRSEVDAEAAKLLSSEIGATVLPWIGGNGGTDPSITSAASSQSRSAFYLLARSFVHHLLDHMDMATFVRLYRSEDTVAAYPALTGRSLDEWRSSWKRSLFHAAAN